MEPQHAITENACVETCKRERHPNPGLCRPRKERSQSGGKQVDGETNSPKPGNRGELQHRQIPQLRVARTEVSALPQAEKVFRRTGIKSFSISGPLPAGCHCSSVRWLIANMSSVSVSVESVACPEWSQARHR